MNHSEPYCSVCQKPVKPIKALVTYYCPTCGATFLASQVEVQESSKKHPPNKADETALPNS
jgi:predicted RNA-binding Zn-ribbon protein involved in translation (DUF1610 family)